LGKVRLLAEETDEALSLFRKAVDADPADATARLSLGLGLKQRRRVEDAIGCYETAIRLDPRLVVAHLALGKALVSPGPAGGRPASAAPSTATRGSPPATPRWARRWWSAGSSTRR